MDVLSTIPDPKYLAMTIPPWELEFRSEHPTAWPAVEMYLAALSNSQPPFRQFASWVICAFARALVERGDKLTVSAIVTAIEDQGAALQACTSLSASSLTTLAMISQHPKEHFDIMMTEAVARLSEVYRRVDSRAMQVQ